MVGIPQVAAVVVVAGEVGKPHTGDFYRRS